MPRALVIALCMIATVSAHAQSYSVAGRVIDAVSGTPLSRATVSLEPETEQGARQGWQQGTDLPSENHDYRDRQPATALASAVTGADGEFRLTGVPAGRYRLLAARRGYLAGALGRHGRFYTAVVVGNNTPGAENIRFALQPLAAIRGTVRDSSGDPVQNAHVTLFGQTGSGDGAVHQLRSTVIPRNAANYTFGGLPPGAYYVAASGSPWFAQHESLPDGSRNPLDVVYPLTFWDGATGSSDATPIQLRAGETADAGFSLAATAAVHVQLPLAPGRGFAVLGENAFADTLPVGSFGIMRRDDGTTTVTVSVAPGAYVLTRGSETTGIDASADVTAPGDGGDAAPVALTGALAMADGAPLPGEVTLLLERNAEGAPDTRGFSSHGGFGHPHFGERPIELTAAANGTLSAAQVPPGDYRLTTDRPGELVVTAAAAQGAELSPSLVLHVGSTPVMLAATLAVADATLSGSVRNGQDAMILLAPQEAGAATLYRQAEAATDGSWSMRNVAPGRYQLFAIRDGWDLAWKEPGVLAPYAAGAVPVTVTSSHATAVPTPLSVQSR